MGQEIDNGEQQGDDTHKKAQPNLPTGRLIHEE